jgi:predicted RNA-binding Zn-ribbon protein involved in translation (DUF1610 family)
VLREGFDAPIARVAIDLQPNAKLRTFWQKVGRIKRPYKGQKDAILLDFAGNYWRHLHPDEDPVWPCDADEKAGEILKRAKQESTKEPWSCPACSYVLSPWERLVDGKCPSCGLQMQRAKRRVVMGDGEMKEVPAKVRKRKVANDNVKRWFQCLYPAVRGGYKLGFARAIYRKNTGLWPDPKKLPMCPKMESLDWNRPAREVFPQLLKGRK